ncbi:hypothetical protein Pmani_012243 [Petrolisthes manimaculis]|uniref:C2H2-type domain-containing protein n=1 Tax=Petrolisthes manimaculis TaxID=1843537 RepID=A0AAE1UEV7_9EUCA|nr:hypothetical protein Pmani_012243 [Petrolisthes manimaculis]
MVDWESTSGFNLEAQRVQTATAATRTKKSASHFDMLREDDSEQLNVMDFVETEYRTDRTNRDRNKCKPNRTNRESTEYKPDKLRGTGRTEYGSDRTNRGKTEYKPDRTNRGGKNARKSSQRKPLLKNSLCVKSSQDPQSVLVSTVQYNNNKVHKPNKTKQHRHAQRNSKILSTKLNSTEVSQCYPYAACLKTLCDQAGSSVQNSAHNLLPEKLFDTLKTVNVHYPYSSLLEELHQNASLEPNHQHHHTPSSMEELHTHESRPFEIASVMRNINVPVRGSDSCINLGVSGVDSYAAPYSGMLMAMVMQQQIQEYANNQHRQQEPTKFESCRVGEILRTQMPVVDKLDSPPHELQSSAILQKLAFSAQEEEVHITRGKNVSKKRSGELPVVLDWSSTESSQCEEDDSEWRPPHWQAKKVTSIVNNTTNKRKTRRKTKRKKDSSGGGGVVSLFTHPSASQDYIPSECITDVQTNYSRSYTHVESESSVCVSATKSSSQLLQLIVGCDGKDTTRSSSSSRKNRKIFKRSKPTKRKEKQQRVVRKRQKDTDIPSWQSSVCDEQITPESTTKQKHTIELECMNEPQSLLKEYLLKPTEEILPVKSCDLPKANTSFLFSRLLQNFKNLAESGKPSMITKKEREDRENQSILRGMLVAGNSSGGSSAAELLSKSKLLSQTIRDDEIADDVGFPRTIIDNPFNPHTSLYDTKSNTCRVKCEDDIKVECEDVFCKVECEEEVFECQVCYLQFSSGLDLSNHKILFHCSADDPLDTNTDTEGRGKEQMVVVPCGGDDMEEEGIGGVGRVSVESSRR